MGRRSWSGGPGDQRLAQLAAFEQTFPESKSKRAQNTSKNSDLQHVCLVGSQDQFRRLLGFETQEGLGGAVLVLSRVLRAGFEQPTPVPQIEHFACRKNDEAYRKAGQTGRVFEPVHDRAATRSSPARRIGSEDDGSRECRGALRVLVAGHEKQSDRYSAEYANSPPVRERFC